MFRWHVDIKAGILSEQIPDVGNVTDVNVVSRGLGGLPPSRSKRRWRKLQDQRPESGKKHAWKYRTCNKEAGRNGNDRNSVLPSAFISIEKRTAEDGSIVFRVYGGGFGHGVE